MQYKLCFKPGKKCNRKLMKWFRLLLEHLVWIEHQFLSGIRDSRKAGSMWGMMRGMWGVRKAIHQSWLAKELGLLCWGFKGVREEIPSRDASTHQIGSAAFPPGQCTGPQLHPCHRLFDQDGHQDSSSASLQSRACSLWLLLIPLAQRLSLWDNWEDERCCDEGHWHAHTRGLPWGLPEVVGMVHVHCSRKRLLRRGLKFHVCTINKSVHTKKVWKLIVCTSNMWLYPTFIPMCISCIKTIYDSVLLLIIENTYLLAVYSNYLLVNIPTLFSKMWEPGEQLAVVSAKSSKLC